MSKWGTQQRLQRRRGYGQGHLRKLGSGRREVVKDRAGVTPVFRGAHRRVLKVGVRHVETQDASEGVVRGSRMHAGRWGVSHSEATDGNTTVLEMALG